MEYTSLLMPHLSNYNQTIFVTIVKPEKTFFLSFLRCGKNFLCNSLTNKIQQDSNLLNFTANYTNFLNEAYSCYPFSDTVYNYYLLVFGISFSLRQVSHLLNYKFLKHRIIPKLQF